MRSLSPGHRAVLPADGPLPHLRQRQLRHHSRQLRRGAQCPSDSRPRSPFPDGTERRGVLPDSLRSRPLSQRALRPGLGLRSPRAKLSLLEGRTALPVTRLLSRPDRGMDEQPRLPRWRSALRARHPAAMSRMPRDRRRPCGPVLRRHHLPEMSRTGRAASRHPQSRGPRPRRPGGALRSLPFRSRRWRRSRRARQSGGPAAAEQVFPQQP